jgi:hypothetical protein
MIAGCFYQSIDTYTGGHHQTFPRRAASSMAGIEIVGTRIPYHEDALICNGMPGWLDSVKRDINNLRKLNENIK